MLLLFGPRGVIKKKKVLLELVWMKEHKYILTRVDSNWEWIEEEGVPELEKNEVIGILLPN